MAAAQDLGANGETLPTEGVVVKFESEQTSGGETDNQWTPPNTFKPGTLFSVNIRLHEDEHLQVSNTKSHFNCEV